MDNVELLLDKWILYRKGEPNVPVVNGQQKDFELAIRKLIREELAEYKKAIHWEDEEPEVLRDPDYAAIQAREEVETLWPDFSDYPGGPNDSSRSDTVTLGEVDFKKMVNDLPLYHRELLENLTIIKKK